MLNPNLGKASPSEAHTCLPSLGSQPLPLCLGFCVQPRRTKSGFVSLKGKPLQKCKTTLTFSPPWHSTHWLTVNLEGPGRNLFKIQAKKKKCLHVFKTPGPAFIFPRRSHSKMPTLLSRPLGGSSSCHAGWLLEARLPTRACGDQPPPAHQ